ncbi:MAG: hypothetical protein ACRDQ4_00295 [Pseudonocardiaceae bacterium]
MTARRRRALGSGPSATALIAWVGAARPSVGEPTSAPGSVIDVIDSGSCGRVPGGRAILLGRACGLAAGTLLACGSVLAGATHVGDGSLAGDSASLLNHTPVVPGAGTSEDYLPPVPPGRTSAAPVMVSAQVVAGPSPVPYSRLGRVRRNTPVSLDIPTKPSLNSGTGQQPWASSSPPAGHAASGPIAPVRPVLDPAAERVGRVAPVGGVLASANPHEEQTGSPREEHAEGLRDEPAVRPHGGGANLFASEVLPAVKHIRTPVDNTVRPAMAMLTSLLSLG